MFTAKKKAFTMIELLICLICLGLLSLGIATFATALKGNVALIDERDQIMSEEYQDVLKLKLDGESVVDDLYYPDNLIKAERLPVNNSFNIDSYYVASPSEKIEISSSDLNVLIINGNSFQTKGPGAAYVQIKIYEKKSDGAYHDVDRIQYIPVITYSPTEAPLITELDYYFYSGQYYYCWINAEV